MLGALAKNVLITIQGSCQAAWEASPPPARHGEVKWQGLWWHCLRSLGEVGEILEHLPSSRAPPLSCEGQIGFCPGQKKTKPQSLVAFPPWIAISFDKLCLFAHRMLPAESNAVDLIIYLIWLSWKCPTYQSFCFPTWTIFPLCLLSLSQLGPICPGSSPIYFHLMGADPSSIPSVYF